MSQSKNRHEAERWLQTVEEDLRAAGFDAGSSGHARRCRARFGGRAHSRRGVSGMAGAAVGIAGRRREAEGREHRTLSLRLGT